MIFRVLVYNIYEMYVCTEKATINEWLKEIEELKAENKRLEELLTKWKDKRIEILIKENRELRKQNKEIMSSYIMSEKAADARIEQLEKELNFYKPNNK